MRENLWLDCFQQQKIESINLNMGGEKKKEKKKNQTKYHEKIYETHKSEN